MINTAFKETILKAGAPHIIFFLNTHRSLGNIYVNVNLECLMLVFVDSVLTLGPILQYTKPTVHHILESIVWVYAESKTITMPKTIF